MAQSIGLVLGLVGLSFSMVPAQAASATQAEADRLKGVFERYLGHPAAGEAGGVSVTPEGETYRVSFDLQQLAKPLDNFGASLEPATATAILAPNDNGSWHVTSDAVPPLVIHMKDQTITLKTSTARFDGTFDPKIPGFAVQTFTQDGSTFDQEGPTATGHGRTGHKSWSQTLTAGEAGVASAESKYSFSELTDQMITRAPKPAASVEVAPSAPPVALSYAIPTGSAEVTLDRFRPGSLLDLWAFFVAHPNHEAIVAAQEDLRGLLRAALPLMGGLKENASLDGLTITSPMGPLSMRTLRVSAALSDLAASGKAAMGVTIDGLNVPSTDLPVWSVGLIPTSFDLQPSVVGFHFDEAAKAAVEDFDLKADGFTPAQRDAISHIAWPGDGHVLLGPSRITSGLLDLKLEGEVAFGGSTSAGHLTLTGAGVDKVIATLQQAVATDPSAAQVLAQFVAAKNLGKPNPDGSLTWLLETTPEGGLTVNGASIK